MPENEQSAELLEHTTRIVAAHVANNAMPAADLPGLIATVHETLATLGAEQEAPRPNPAVLCLLKIPSAAEILAFGRIGVRSGHA